MANHSSILPWKIPWTEEHNGLQSLGQELSKAENVMKFELLADEWTQDNGFLTPTLKVKRNKISKRYAELIDSMFADHQ